MEKDIDEALVLNRLARASVWSIDSNHPNISGSGQGGNGESETLEVDLGDAFLSPATSAGASPTAMSPSPKVSSPEHLSASPPTRLTPTPSQPNPLITHPIPKLLSHFSSRLPTICWRALISNILRDRREDEFEWVPPVRDWPFNDLGDKPTSTSEFTTSAGQMSL